MNSHTFSTYIHIYVDNGKKDGTDTSLMFQKIKLIFLNALYNFPFPFALTFYA